MKLPTTRNIFVLCTGRNGSVAFAKACSHFTNYSAGHETRVKFLGDERLAYPERHIEADNRLSWFLGRLEAKYGDDAIYVFLRRDPDKVAASYNKRWELRGGIISAYATAIAYQTNLGLDVAKDLVRTVEENISLFLKNKTRVFRIDIEDIGAQFANFAKEIKAEGDIDAALLEFSQRHNASTEIRDTSYSGEENTTAAVHYGLINIIDHYRKLGEDFRRQLKVASDRVSQLRLEINNVHSASRAKLADVNAANKAKLAEVNAANKARLAEINSANSDFAREVRVLERKLVEAASSEERILGKIALNAARNPARLPLLPVTILLERRKLRRRRSKEGV